jgi:hypothetical protein
VPFTALVSLGRAAESGFAASILGATCRINITGTHVHTHQMPGLCPELISRKRHLTVGSAHNSSKESARAGIVTRPDLQNTCAHMRASRLACLWARVCLRVAHARARVCDGFLRLPDAAGACMLTTRDLLNPMARLLASFRARCTECCTAPSSQLRRYGYRRTSQTKDAAQHRGTFGRSIT